MNTEAICKALFDHTGYKWRWDWKAKVFCHTDRLEQIRERSEELDLDHNIVLVVALHNYEGWFPTKTEVSYDHEEGRIVAIVLTKPWQITDHPDINGYELGII